MAYMNKFTQSDDYRREELIRIIEHSVEKLTPASIRPTAFTNPQSAGQYYTLTGLRVAAGTKGLLIMGGKKRIFK